MECLSDLCTSNGQAIPGTQELICEAIFSDEVANADIIFRTQFKVGAVSQNRPMKTWNPKRCVWIDRLLILSFFFS